MEYVNVWVCSAVLFFVVFFLRFFFNASSVRVYGLSAVDTTLSTQPANQLKMQNKNANFRSFVIYVEHKL